MGAAPQSEEEADVVEAEGPLEKADGADEGREGAVPKQELEATEETKATQAPHSATGEGVSGSAASAAVQETGDAPRSKSKSGRTLRIRPSDPEAPLKKAGRTVPATPIATPARERASSMGTSTRGPPTGARVGGQFASVTSQEAPRRSRTRR